MTQSSLTSAPILEARHVVKRFPGVVALKDVSFDLRPGEIHALCGENGAGKSTLIKTLSGLHPYGSYEGEIYIAGALAQFRDVADAEKAGLAVIYQELALVPELSVAENIFLGKEPTRGGLIDWLTIFSESRRLLEQFGLEIDPARPVGDLGVGLQQLVEIVKALAKKSRILILDEPTAALSEQEVQILLNLMRDLRKQGISCIYISHKLDEVLSIADRITVLRDGQTIVTMDAEEATKAQIIRQMVGREITDMFPARVTMPDRVRLSVRNLSVMDKQGRLALENISFDVHAGEVVGIGGLMGAGRSELLMHLFGAWGRRVSGEVTLDEVPLEHVRPHEAIAAGLVLVSEDRKRYGLILEQGIGFNLSLSSLRQLRAYGLIDQNREFQQNKKMFTALRIKAPSLETTANTLSGGNQQKIVIGKALMTDPKVVFLDEPTRGIDVGAKVEIYQIINQLTAEGLGVVLVSSELPELLGMSDRVIMLHEGMIGGVFDRAQATQERVMAAAMGQPAASK